MGTPLRPETNRGSETPEALFLSALIEEGVFIPRRYGISIEDLDVWQEVYSFCQMHQDSAGCAPSLNLMRVKHPDFPLTSDVNPDYAARELREESSHRRLRMAMQEASVRMGEGDVKGAHELLAALRLPSSNRKEPADGFDHTTIAESFETPKLPVPFKTLGRINGGIALGDLWVLGARLGQGKSSVACAYVASAVLSGARVGYWSLEMPAEAILQKIRICMSAGNPKLQSRLESPSVGDRKDALDQLREMTSGSFYAFDPSHGRCTPDEVEDTMNEYDLVVVDHAGLMTDNKGRRAIEDWRVQGEISNRLKEGLLRTSGRCLALNQVNRQGDSNNPRRTPRASEMAGSDDIGRDADVLITMQRYGSRAMTHYTEKNRNYPQVKWYTRFNPANGDFTEIDPEKAAEMYAEEDNSMTMTGF